MKVRNWHKKVSTALAAGGVACAGVAQAATTLTGLQDTNQPVPADHGSNASGTPNIALMWDERWDQYAGWPNDPGGGVYQVDQAEEFIMFTPAPGWRASLTSFNLNVWPGGGETNVNWSVEGAVSGTLGSGSTVTADGTVSTTNLNIVGGLGEKLTLNFHRTTGLPSYLAMDNLVFDQVGVPEPTAAILALAGLGAAAMRRKRD